MPDYLVTFEATEKRLCTASVMADSPEEAGRIAVTGDGVCYVITDKPISVKENKAWISSERVLTYSEIVEALNRGDVLYNHSYKEYYWIDTLHIPNLGDTKVLLCLGYPANNDIVHGVHRYELSKLEGTACIITVYKSKSEETNNEAVSV